MDVFLKQFTDETFPDFFSIYLEENGEESFLDPGLRERIARSAIDSGHSIVRGIWSKEAGGVLGYCEVQNVEEPVWEVGIYVLERHRFRGVGKAAMPLFFDELAAAGRHAFAAKILPSNDASRRLFEGIGAELVGTEVLAGAVSNEVLEREVIARKDGASPEERERLQALEDAIRETKQEVCLYRIEWPPNR